MRDAITRMCDLGWVIRAESRFYSTPAFPAGNGPDYVNAVVLVEVDEPIGDCLASLHQIEADAGRERVQRWGQRTLDLDIIAAGDRVLPDANTYKAWVNLPVEEQMRKTPAELILPHPRVQDRAFVLVPLADVWPDWVHPVSGLDVAEMLLRLPKEDKAAIVALPTLQ